VQRRDGRAQRFGQRTAPMLDAIGERFARAIPMTPKAFLARQRAESAGHGATQCGSSTPSAPTLAAAARNAGATPEKPCPAGNGSGR
jgi:hypothetical protein